MKKLISCIALTAALASSPALADSTVADSTELRIATLAPSGGR